MTPLVERPGLTAQAIIDNFTGFDGSFVSLVETMVIVRSRINSTSFENVTFGALGSLLNTSSNHSVVTMIDDTFDS